MSTPIFNPEDFRNIWGLLSKTLLSIGCYPGQSLKESYLCVRKLGFYADDSLKLAHWISHSNAEWPLYVVSFVSGELLKLSIPFLIHDKLKNYPQSKSATIRFERYGNISERKKDE